MKRHYTIFLNLKSPKRLPINSSASFEPQKNLTALFFTEIEQAIYNFCNPVTTSMLEHLSYSNTLNISLYEKAKIYTRDGWRPSQQKRLSLTSDAFWKSTT